MAAGPCYNSHTITIHTQVRAAEDNAFPWRSPPPPPPPPPAAATPAAAVDLTSANSVEGHAAAVRGAVLVVRAALSARRAGAVPWVECLPVGVLRC